MNFSHSPKNLYSCMCMLMGFSCRQLVGVCSLKDIGDCFNIVMEKNTEWIIKLFFFSEPFPWHMQVVICTLCFHIGYSLLTHRILICAIHAKNKFHCLMRKICLYSRLPSLFSLSCIFSSLYCCRRCIYFQFLRCCKKNEECFCVCRNSL